ncbi:DUF397 domain-containing protein [Kibdelosporangium persicum]|uniref:DUF397 domain-containing protein n=1 Tax=Kibdelosporangium persicum TaxID=2698649 RepID=UPI0028A696CF|nr:DUF397 domain-containing protein [Kibdelosporangium persicum]
MRVVDSLDWRKSSRSTSGSDAGCVEVAQLPRLAAVRDSKNPEAGVLTFPAAPWATFLAALD